MCLLLSTTLAMTLMMKLGDKALDIMNPPVRRESKHANHTYPSSSSWHQGEEGEPGFGYGYGHGLGGKEQRWTEKVRY